MRKPHPVNVFLPADPVSGEASSWSVDRHLLALSSRDLSSVSAGGERVYKFSGFSSYKDTSIARSNAKNNIIELVL